MISQMKGRSLSTHVQFVWLECFRHILYAVVHAQRVLSKAEADDGTFKY